MLPGALCFYIKLKSTACCCMLLIASYRLASCGAWSHHDQATVQVRCPSSCSLETEGENLLFFCMWWWKKPLYPKALSTLPCIPSYLSVYCWHMHPAPRIHMCWPWVYNGHRHISASTFPLLVHGGISGVVSQTPVLCRKHSGSCLAACCW